jgi:hypothetical protein
VKFWALCLIIFLQSGCVPKKDEFQEFEENQKLTEGFNSFFTNLHKDLGPGGSGCTRLILPLVKDGKLRELTSEQKNTFGAPDGFVMNSVRFIDFDPQGPWINPMTVFYIEFKLATKKKLPGPEKSRTIHFNLKVNPLEKKILGCPSLDDYK